MGTHIRRPTISPEATEDFMIFVYFRMFGFHGRFSGKCRSRSFSKMRHATGPRSITPAEVDLADLTGDFCHGEGADNMCSFVAYASTLLYCPSHNDKPLAILGASACSSCASRNFNYRHARDSKFLNYCRAQRSQITIYGKFLTMQLILRKIYDSFIKMLQ